MFTRQWRALVGERVSWELTELIYLHKFEITITTCAIRKFYTSTDKGCLFLEEQTLNIGLLVFLI